MTAINIPTAAMRAPVNNRWVRNGKYPDASFQTTLSTQTNHAARWLTKEVFSYSCPIAAIPSSGGAGSRNRWRFAWHSGPYVRRLWGLAIMAPRSNADNTDSPHALVTITNGAGSTIGTMEFHYGVVSNVGGATDTPAYFAPLRAILESGGSAVTLTADTDYYGLVADVDNARIMSLTIWEESLESDTSNGYVPDVQALSPVFDEDRGDVAAILRSMWKRGGAHLLNWTADTQAAPREVEDPDLLNVIDTSIGSVSSSSPGFVLDFTNRTRVSGAGVPVVMKVYGAKGSASGFVYLKDSGGVTRVTVEVDSTADWYSATTTIPSASGKYDLMFESTGGTFSLYAVSLYQYAA